VTINELSGVFRSMRLGVSVADWCRKHGVSDASIYKWKTKFGGIEVSEAKRLRTLEDENARLKRLLVDSMLDNAALKGPFGKEMATPAAERRAVAHLRATFGRANGGRVAAHRFLVCSAATNLLKC
jgi:putative transposase